MCGMDDCILAENCYTKTNNFNSTQTISSPVQMIQPSSTQDSFAKSIGPALIYSLCFSLCLYWPLSSAFLSQAGPQCSHCLHKVKMVDGCQRPHRWMGNSHWVSWVGGMPRSESNTFKISGPLEQCCR